ncbi:hypothetical protein [Aliiroseovarius subalbicans]|uniref:hypothetical protein n=1 Tax=Aliiroseovarius subalbicans TaxID=2925840 RepID=UPI001F576B01|nr:hypothetical protein [Aliiroseovarius subalbicans]MCI2399690.1 hypothetical protein [Aliiroseovarius subalbicans]
MEYSSISSEGIDPKRPLIYRIDVINGGVLRSYIGQSVNAARPLRAHLVLAGQLLTRDTSNRSQRVHRAMADAIRAGGSVHLALLENCPVAQLTARETHWWETLRPSLNALKPGLAGFKQMKRTPNRDRWFDAFLTAEDWSTLRRNSPPGAWGAAVTSFGARFGLSKEEALAEFPQFLEETHVPPTKP